MCEAVVSRLRIDSRMQSCLRLCLISGVTTFALLISGVDAYPQSSVVQSPASLTIDTFDDLGIDPIMTGAIDPLSRDGNAGADILHPSTIHYRLPEGRARKSPLDELGMPMPDAPLPVVINAPDVKTMIGVRLLSDETVLKSALPVSQREAILKAYEARGFKPFWIKNGAWSEAAQSVLAVLGEAHSHGLPPARYLVPSIASGRIQSLADADIRLSVAAVSYARDARGGLLDRNKLGPLAMPMLDLPGAEKVLEDLMEKGAKAGDVLSGYQPASPGYQALRTKLVALQKLSRDLEQSAAAKPMARLSDSPAPRLSQLDKRNHGHLGLNPADDPVTARSYDMMLAEAVAAFQAQSVEGASTGPVVMALAGSSMNMLPVNPADIARLEMALRINMERWRWLPHNLSKRYVQINVPGQDAKIFDNDIMIHRVLGVVGRVDTPTPIFSGHIGTIVLNPEWLVPQTRIDDEITPGILRDVNYAIDRGYEIIREGRRIKVREPARVRYELGQIKFLLTNNPSFYLHNTPDHSLFENEFRALSKGKVRVDDPFKFAEIILEKKWTAESLSKMIGGGERILRLAKPMPIHMTYFTMAIDSDGKITTYPDVYGYDQGMKNALDNLDKGRPYL